MLKNKSVTFSSIPLSAYEAIDMNIKSMIIIFLFASSSTYAASYEGRYCELEGAKTSSGVRVKGECYMYSDEYGELDSARTVDGEHVRGECYRYSSDYAELEGARTASGERVRGECYFY